MLDWQDDRHPLQLPGLMTLTRFEAPLPLPARSLGDPQDGASPVG